MDFLCAHGWKRLTDKALIRSTVSTSRSWQGYHEAKRAELEAFVHEPDSTRKGTAKRAQNWSSKGPSAREFLRRRPVPSREQLLCRFYLSKGKIRELRAMSTSLEAHSSKLEQNTVYLLVQPCFTHFINILR